MRFPWQQHDDDLQRELAHHLAELTDEFIRRGHSPEEAARLAKKEFGGPTQIAEQLRADSPWSWLTSFLQDLRYGLRQLRQTPVVTVACILSLALGIGANSALFSLMNTVLWRNLPVPAPEQLVLVHWQGQGFPDRYADNAAGSMHRDGATQTADFFSYAAFSAMRQAVGSRALLSTYSFPEVASLSFAGRPFVATNRPVGGSFFQALQVQPQLGRLLTPGDDQPDAPAVAVLTHRLWTDSFGADPQVLGKTLRIDNQSFEIVGVLPASFYGLIPGDATLLYTPVWKTSVFARAVGNMPKYQNPRAWVTQILARLAPGETPQSVQPLLAAAFQQSWDRSANSKAKHPDPQLLLADGRRGLGDLSRNFRQPLLVLSSLLALVLLIACANIANLLLARSAARAKEVALRLSLGCTRARLLRQFVTESSLLALGSGLASVLVAYATARGLAVYLQDRHSSVPLPIAIDLPMLLSIACISLLTLLLFGLVPAWRATRIDTSAALKEGSGSLGAAARHWWTPGRLLIVGQMSLSLILVSTALLFVENLRAVQSQDPGFDRRNLLLFDLRPGTSGYQQAQLPNFYRQLEQRLASTPGVAGVGLIRFRPMNQGGWWEDYRVAGESKPHSTSANLISANYFAALQLPLKEGRNFHPADFAEKAPKVAIISEDFARTLRPRASALGLILHQVGSPQPDPVEVIGVAPAIALASLKERPLGIWMPYPGFDPQITVVVRTAADPSAVLPQVRATLADLDRNLPLIDVFTMEEQISRGLQRERMFATLCGSFGCLALLLSVIGLYGVMSYSASRRRTEIGVRLALGADRTNVVWMILREALCLTALGLLLAAPAIYLGSGYVEKELFSLRPLNPVLLTASVALLTLSASLAAWLPARRASRLDPMSALRQE